MVRSQATRASILRELEDERQVIIDRYLDSEGLSAPLHPTHHLPWYLDISKEWGLNHLLALSRMPIGTLLDIGAYYGLIAGVAYRMGWRVAAVDVRSIPAYSSLKIPERKIECSIYNACTDALPFPDQSFDAILLCEVLEHLMYSPLPMFREIKRVLRPDGHLLISTPNPAGLGKLIALALGAAPLEPALSTWILSLLHEAVSREVFMLSVINRLLVRRLLRSALISEQRCHVHLPSDLCQQACHLLCSQLPPPFPLFCRKVLRQRAILGRNLVRQIVS